MTKKTFIKPSWEYLFIDSQEALSKFSSPLNSEEVLSIDTETAGWQSGNDYLCLLQIGLPSTEQVLLIDALAIEDLGIVKEVLEDEEIIKVAHYAAFEKRILAKSGIELAGEIDTIDQAKLLRPDLPSYKLSTCVKAVLGADLTKEQQTSDWSVRPLSDEQLAYAALDAEIAYKLYSEFTELEEQLEIPENAKAAKLMKQLFEVSKEKFELLEPIAKKYYFLDVLEEELRDRIHDLIASKEEDFSSSFGTAKYRSTKRTIIDPNLIRKELPSLADEIIEERVTKTKFKSFMQEHELEKDILQRVEKLSGEYDSVSIKVKDWLTEK